MQSGFLDKAGLAVVIDPLKIEPRLVLRTREEDGARRAYGLVENGLWRICEMPIPPRRGGHSIEFLPLAGMRHILVGVTSDGRESLLGTARGRFYKGLASTNLEISFLTGEAWTIGGECLAEGASSDSDECLAATFALVFEFCRIASESGVVVRILSPGDLESFSPLRE